MSFDPSKKRGQKTSPPRYMQGPFMFDLNMFNVFICSCGVVITTSTSSFPTVRHLDNSGLLIDELGDV